MVSLLSEEDVLTLVCLPLTLVLSESRLELFWLDWLGGSRSFLKMQEKKMKDGQRVYSSNVWSRTMWVVTWDQIYLTIKSRHLGTSLR